MTKSSRAFTLIELVLALSIFAVVAVCVYGTFWSGINLSRRAESEGAVYHQMRLAFDLMSAELENAVFYDFSDSYPEQTAFEGEAGQVTFLTAARDGLKVVRYHLAAPQEGRVHQVMIGKTFKRNVSTLADYREEGGRLYDLIREQWDFAEYLSGIAGEDHQEEIVATGITADGLKFSFGYLPEGKEKEDANGYEWHDKWTHSYIPLMVRIEMRARQPRAVGMSKNVFIPDGLWGKPSQT
ncbi:MAG: prepilin-type N-terminal cleavage/methylation domain-containing protein [Candidatus Omnitrophica bacterium]|nr:prepilin-type N-terminal cleavage/methylation domain-containing protein [Candidatus Omnitrophota bacterium]